MNFATRYANVQTVCKPHFLKITSVIHKIEEVLLERSKPIKMLIFDTDNTFLEQIHTELEHGRLKKVTFKISRVLILNSQDDEGLHLAGDSIVMFLFPVRRCKTSSASYRSSINLSNLV